MKISLVVSVSLSALLAACGTDEVIPSGSSNLLAANAPQGEQLSAGKCLGIYQDWTSENNAPFFPTANQYGLQMLRFAQAHPECEKAARNPSFLNVAF